MGILKEAEGELKTLATDIEAKLLPAIDAAFEKLLPRIEALVANRSTQIVAAILTKLSPAGLDASVAMSLAAGLVNSLTDVPAPTIAPAFIVPPAPASTVTAGSAVTAQKATS
jgi:hypothetical protein